MLVNLGSKEIVIFTVVAFITKYKIHINHCRFNNNYKNITCFPPLVILFSVLEKPHVNGLNGFLSQLVNYLKGCA